MHIIRCNPNREENNIDLQCVDNKFSNLTTALLA